MAVKRISGGRSSPRPSRGKTPKTPSNAPARKAKAVRAGFVTDETLEVLEFLGATSPFLRFAPGKAVLNLRKIMPPLLYGQVLQAVKMSAKTPVAKRSGVALLLGSRRTKINIEVTRLKYSARGGARYRILIEDVGPSPRGPAKPKARPEPEQTGTQSAARLEEHLRAERESFREVFEEQEQKYELALEQLAAAREESEAFAANLEVTHTELEATHAELEAASAELRAALAESEGQVRALLETAAQGVLAVERDGRIQMVNRTVEQMFGYRRGDLLGQPVEMLLPEGPRTAHRQHRRDFFAHPRTRPMGQGLDLFARRKDGTTFPVEISLSYIEAEGGVAAVAFISDITERKRGDQALRESEERFRLAAQCGNDLIYEWDLDTNELQWWGNVESFLGQRPKTLAIFQKWVHPKDSARVMAAVEKHLRTGEPFVQEYRIKARNGTYRCWLDQGIASRDEQGKPRKWIGACTDITGRKQAEEALRRSHGDLRSLTARLTALQEEQYKHLARELHDVFSQKLTMLGMQVGEMEHRWSESGLAQGEEVGPIGTQISALAADIHGISRRLHPAILDDLGLAAALENECRHFAREHGLELTFRAEGTSERTPGDVALCLYRIAQESLNNIRKHAKTDRVEMVLAGAPNETVLSIEDFGKGFEPDAVRGKGGLGLVSMEERVRLVGGQLKIRSKPGGGTKVEVRAPLKRALRKKSTEPRPKR